MGDAKKPDFSNVQSGASSTAPPAPKADFGNVQSGVESTAPTRRADLHGQQGRHALEDRQGVLRQARTAGTKSSTPIATRFRIPI